MGVNSVIADAPTLLSMPLPSVYITICVPAFNIAL